MSSEICNVLLIEDKLDNVKLVQELLVDAQNSSLANGLNFPITCVANLEEGMTILADHSFDVILLDLILPDSQGFDTLIKIREKFPNIPIIVETENNDETLVVKSFQLGADGYLQIQSIDSNLLVYAIRLAIERQKYRNQIALGQQKQQQAVEIADLESIVSAGISTSITARMFGADSLQESVPDLFEELAQIYGNLLELALEQRMFKVDHNISEQLKMLADKLGFLKASPRDAIEIHTKILKEKSGDVTLARTQAYVSEGRIMILELIGYLASFYRKYYIRLSNITISHKSDYR
ncbi:response regulator [Aphanothece sacrum]|uniref:Chemotaxis protein CheY n=1 Tax=Aphanothece sacrum FPU1 TaxID=1920663 RepID=A0A401IHW7_APHSA|nr:response regulator [Aphanothece sacrum]GBF80868.1 chemotaxis protein CheY [Aphanothece sacrum FPU1]GBF85176.1 chemotaxis protein CheY [Aphanothece sacrum FPU3]